MSKPMTINGYNFEQPYVTVSKVKELEDDGVEFLEDIAEILGKFGVRVLGIHRIEAGNGRVWLRLYISNEPENLVRLWGRVNYEYNPLRRRLALAAVAWLRLKERVIEERASVERQPRFLPRPVLRKPPSSLRLLRNLLMRDLLNVVFTKAGRLSPGFLRTSRSLRIG